MFIMRDDMWPVGWINTPVGCGRRSWTHGGVFFIDAPQDRWASLGGIAPRSSAHSLGGHFDLSLLASLQPGLSFARKKHCDFAGTHSARMSPDRRDTETLQ